MPPSYWTRWDSEPLPDHAVGHNLDRYGWLKFKNVGMAMNYNSYASDLMLFPVIAIDSSSSINDNNNLMLFNSPCNQGSSTKRLVAEIWRYS
jgi:hypothetical protein